MPTDFGHAVGQFGVNKRANQREEAAGHPGAKNHGGRVYEFCDNIRVDEYAGADDAAHHNHGRVENSQASGETRGRACRFRLAGSSAARLNAFWHRGEWPALTGRGAIETQQAVRIYHRES